MDIGFRLRWLREEKKLSQGDIEQRTGLLRCYISRIENGHTIPAVETLTKMARALEMPLYQFLYDGNKPPSSGTTPRDKHLWGETGKDARFLDKLRRSLARMNECDRKLLLRLVEQLPKRRG
ncbi:MAG TPA: helix-turn-helix transcriptional regulator [Candidatus Dormibacteraeota bacterium]|nr:helix-turn-helix transcriptional regulator [Candidatus Dormibacteraeota bacterium]